MSDSRELIFTPPRGMSAKDIDQYFGVWAVESKRAADIWASLQAYEFNGTQAASREFDVERTKSGARVAHVDIRGVMTKRGSSLSDAGSTVATRRAISQAADDPKVDGIFLRIESPGGSAAGTAELGDAIHAASQQKPVVAYIEDIGASAAYWAASQAGHVFANRSAEVGSIGVFTVVADQSEQAADMGIKVHVIRAGEFKGAGTPGTEITEAQLAELQQRIDTTFDQFVEAVDRGRASLTQEQVRELADGRVHSAPVAVNRGLIDGVKSESQSLAFLEELIMSKSTSDAPVAATLKDLRAELPGADTEFFMTCLDRSMTIDDARDAWMIEMSDRLAAKEKAEQDSAAEAARLKEENATLKKKHTGVEPVGDSAASSGDSGDTSSWDSPRSTWHSKISDKMKASGISHDKAASIVAREHPGLREAMIEQANSRR